MNMKVRPETSIVSIDIYGIDVILLSTQEEIDDFIELNDLRKDTYPECNGYAAFFKKEGGRGFVMMSHDWEVATLVHESVHMAHFIMDELDIPISVKNTEAEAYLVGYLFKEAFNILFEMEN